MDAPPRRANPKCDRRTRTWVRCSVAKPQPAKNTLYLIIENPISFPQGTKTVDVGSSSSWGKTVSVPLDSACPVLLCPTHMKQGIWAGSATHPDIFAIVVTHSGTTASVLAHRQDSPSAWGMDLSFVCNCAEAVYFGTGHGVFVLLCGFEKKMNNFRSKCAVLVIPRISEPVPRILWTGGRVAARIMPNEFRDRGQAVCDYKRKVTARINLPAQ